MSRHAAAAFAGGKVISPAQILEFTKECVT
jgi:hypothetical protein